MNKGASSNVFVYKTKQRLSLKIPEFFPWNCWEVLTHSQACPSVFAPLERGLWVGVVLARVCRWHTSRRHTQDQGPGRHVFNSNSDQTPCWEVAMSELWIFYDLKDEKVYTLWRLVLSRCSRKFSETRDFLSSFSVHKGESAVGFALCFPFLCVYKHCLLLIQTLPTYQQSPSWLSYS